MNQAIGNARTRAGGRRRHARPLLARRGRADFARSTGARGQGHARGRAHRRRRQRRLQRRHAGRAGQLPGRRRRRRARPPARSLAARNRHRHAPQARPGPEDHREAARHRPPPAAAAHGLRERARPRGAGPAERNLRPAVPAARRRAVLRLRQGRPGPHRHHDRRGARRPARRCWSTPRVRTIRATAAPPSSRPTGPSCSRSSGSWHNDDELRAKAQKLREALRARRLAGDAGRRWHDAVRRAGRLPCAGPGARGFRRDRRRATR